MMDPRRWRVVPLLVKNRIAKIAEKHLMEKKFANLAVKKTRMEVNAEFAENHLPKKIAC